MGKIRRLTDDKKTPDKLTRVIKQKKVSEYLQTAASKKVKVKPNDIKKGNQPIIGKLVNMEKYKLFQFQMTKPKSKGKDPSQRAAGPGNSSEEQSIGGTELLTQQGSSHKEPKQDGVQGATLKGDDDEEHPPRTGGIRTLKQGDGDNGHLPSKGRGAALQQGDDADEDQSRMDQPVWDIQGQNPVGDSDTAPRAGPVVPQPMSSRTTTGGTPPTVEMESPPRRSGAGSTGHHGPIPMEEEDHPREEGGRQRRDSKRKRESTEMGEVEGRLTEVILNGDAGKNIEPKRQRVRSPINNKTLSEGNGPTPNFFVSRNEAQWNTTPQPTARAAGGGTLLQGTLVTRQSQGQLTPPVRDPATHRANTGRQHTPDMGATRNEVRLKRQAFENLF